MVTFLIYYCLSNKKKYLFLSSDGWIYGSGGMKLKYIKNHPQKGVIPKVEKPIGEEIWKIEEKKGARGGWKSNIRYYLLNS